MDYRRNGPKFFYATLCISIVTLMATPSFANEQMMRRERSGGTMRDVGTGLAIGVVTGIIVNQLTKPGDPPARKAARKPKKDPKLVAKKPPPKPEQAATPPQEPVKQAHPLHGQTPPPTPVTNTTETPPNTPTTQTPPGTPPGSPPTATGTPPTDKPPTTAEKPPEKPVDPPIDITKLTPPVGTGKDGLAHDPEGGGIFVVAKDWEPVPGSICGPDITENVFAVLRSMKTMFEAWPQKQVEACRSLIDPQVANNAWDIIDLAPRTAGTWLTSYVSNMCAIPRPLCTASVEFLGACYHAQVVNYVQWGLMLELCGGAYPELGSALHGARNIGLSIKGVFTSGNAPTQAQLRMTDVGAEYKKLLEKDPNPDTGPDSEIRKKHIAASKLISRTELRCNLHCVADENRRNLLKETAFRFRWMGLTPPEVDDARYDGREGR